jgi:hypothetical protein
MQALRLVLPIAVAVGLGPLIAGLAFSLLAVVLGGFNDPTSLSDLDTFKMIIFYVMFAYIMGAPIALLAGLLVSIWMLWREPNVMVALVAAAAATSIYMGIGALGVLGPAQYTNARSNFILTLVLAELAAAGCCFSMRFLAPSSL